MICPRCEEFKKMLLVEKYIVISEPKKAIFLEKFFDELSTKQSVKSKCKNCGEIIDFDVNLSKFDLSKLGNVEIDEIHFYIKGTCEKCLEKKN